MVQRGLGQLHLGYAQEGMNRLRGILTSPLVAGFLAACLALFLFAELAERVLDGETQRFDQWVRLAVHRTASPALTTLMLALTFLGSVAFVSATALVSSLVLWRMGHRRRAALLLAGFAGASLLMYVLKLYFRRARPEPFFDAVLPASYSFPSGHALVSFCIYGILAAFATRHLASRWWRIVIWTLAVSLILGIGLSRIYLGVHYPSDVLAGYLAATVWTVAITLAYRNLRGNRPRT